MNNKGFTLIELLATICLLAVIAVISFVSINGVLKKSKVSDCESLISNIKSASKEYISDNRYNLDGISSYMVNGNDKKYLINVSVLVNNNYLSGPIINPFDSSTEMNDTDVNISIELKDDYTVNKIIIKNSSNNDVVCENEKW